MADLDRTLVVGLNSKPRSISAFRFEASEPTTVREDLVWPGPQDSGTDVDTPKYFSSFSESGNRTDIFTSLEAQPLQASTSSERAVAQIQYKDGVIAAQKIEIAKLKEKLNQKEEEELQAHWKYSANRLQALSVLVVTMCVMAWAAVQLATQQTNLPWLPTLLFLLIISLATVDHYYTHSIATSRAAPSLQDHIMKGLKQINELIHTGKFFCPACWTDGPCRECKHPYRDHTLASAECPCCCKNNFQPPRITPVKSHAFPKSWLACFNNDKVVFDASKHLRDDDQRQLTAGECKWNLLCKKHDRSTGTMELLLRQRLEMDRYKPTDAFILKEDAYTLQIVMYRALLVNIYLPHYEGFPYYQGIIDFLVRAQQYLSMQQEETGKKDEEEIGLDQAQLLFCCLKERLQSCMVEFLIICEVDLSDINSSLKCCPMIYAQFPPLGCYSAVPLYPEMTGTLQPHFPEIVKRVNNKLSAEHEKLFNSNSDAQKWKDNLKKLEKKRPNDRRKAVKRISELETKYNKMEEGPEKEAVLKDLNSLKQRVKELGDKIEPRLIIRCFDTCLKVGPPSLHV